MTDKSERQDGDGLREALERSQANHKHAVETKRRTDARLRIALAALQQIYTVCNDNAGENCDQRMTVNSIRESAGDGFEKATAETSRKYGPVEWSKGVLDTVYGGPVSTSAPIPPADPTQQSGLYQGEPRCFYPGCGCGDLRACYPDRVVPPADGASETLMGPGIDKLFERDDLFTARAVCARLRNFGYNITLSPSPAVAAEPVAWRIFCTNNGATGYLYTEQLPFDPGPGVRGST